MARTVFRHRMFDVELAPVQTLAGEAEFVRLKVDDWVNVAAVTDDGDLVLVRQYRFGIDQMTLEIPGGIVDAGEPPATAALRELREETGFGGGTVHALGWVHANPAIQNNRTFLFAALGVRVVGEPEPDPEEDIEVSTMPLRDLAARLADGTFTHTFVLNTCHALLARRDHPAFAPYFARSAARAG